MGIRFACPHCGGTMNVKEHLAGKRGICKHCQGKVDIPLKSTIEKGTRPGGIASAGQPATASTGASVAAAVPVAPMRDPISEAPSMNWYVLPPGGSAQYGPAAGDVFRAWIAEGRVSSESMVWRQDWPEWRRAGDVLPQLIAAPVAPINAAAVPVPDASMLDGVPPERLRGASASMAVRASKQIREQRTRTIVMALVVLIFALLPLVYFVIRR